MTHEEIVDTLVVSIQNHTEKYGRPSGAFLDRLLTDTLTTYRAQVLEEVEQAVVKAYHSPNQSAFYAGDEKFDRILSAIEHPTN